MTQFGFQANINTLQAAIETEASLETQEKIITAVLDLTKAYDRVVR